MNYELPKGGRGGRAQRRGKSLVEDSPPVESASKLSAGHSICEHGICDSVMCFV